jgi:replicative DNA helicase
MPARSAPRREPESDDRELPWSLEAERSVLGAILAYGEAFGAVEDRLEPADFWRAAHRDIFAAMQEVAAAGPASIDLVTVCDALRRRGRLDAAGGPAYVSSLADGVPRSANVAHYAGIVQERARLRDAIATANRLLVEAHGGEKGAADLASDAAEHLLDLSGAAMPGAPVRIGELMSEAIETIERTQASEGGAVTGVATGFAQLDEMTAGLQPTDLILIGGRTSQGKTALAMNIARYAAETLPVLVFSLEMSKQQLFVRLLASEARVDSHRLRTGHMLDSDWPKISAAMQSLSEAHLYVDDTPAIGVREVRARARKIRADHGLALIIVDYVQLMRGRGHFDNRTQELGTISRGLKACAKELEVPLVALAQLSRAPEGGFGRKARRPQLSDLRESGDLENDADLVLLIYRPEPKNESDEMPPAEIIVAKARNGPTGTIKFGWSPAYISFDNNSMV